METAMLIRVKSCHPKVLLGSKPKSPYIVWSLAFKILTSLNP